MKILNMCRKPFANPKPETVDERQRRTPQPNGSVQLPLATRDLKSNSVAPRQAPRLPYARDSGTVSASAGSSIEARLSWPNGKTSKGQVEQAEFGAVFCIDPKSKVIKQRSRHAPKNGSSPVIPRPLPVIWAESRWQPALPSLSDLDIMKKDGGVVRLHFAGSKSQLRTMDANVTLLGDLANLAGGRGVGGNDMHSLLVLRLMADCTRSIASRCADTEAALRAADALAGPFVEVRFQGGPAFHEAHGNVAGVVASQKFSELPGGQFSEEVAGLAAGEHRFINVVQSDQENGVHEMGLAVTRLSQNTARLTIINTNGWDGVLEGIATALSKTLEISDACTALENLLSGQMPMRDGCGSESGWRAPEHGIPLLAWLDKLGPADAQLESNFHGVPFDTKPQKANDCIVESKLAWLATVMPPRDYKLAKATLLGCLKELGANQKLLHPKAAKRLNERMTTSLSGSLVAPG